MKMQICNPGHDSPVADCTRKSHLLSWRTWPWNPLNRDIFYIDQNWPLNWNLSLLLVFVCSFLNSKRQWKHIVYSKNHYRSRVIPLRQTESKLLLNLKGWELGTNVTTRKAQISKDKINNIITGLLSLLGVDGPQTLKDEVILNLIVHTNYLESL